MTPFRDRIGLFCATPPWCFAFFVCRFVAGQVLKTDDPEEEKRQKSYQGILNKITPDNFDILTRKASGASLSIF